MNYQQGGGGQFPQQGPRKLLKQRVFNQEGPAMTSTPYQRNFEPPSIGFNMTPQMDHGWANETPQNFQTNTFASTNMYAPSNNFQPQPAQIYGQQQQQPPQLPPQQHPYMTPQYSTPQAPFPGYPGFADIISNPMVSNMAKQYGQSLIQNAGDQMLGRFSGLKYYFAVDTRYVMKKLKLVLFPFIHKDWAVQYQLDQSPSDPASAQPKPVQLVQPRFDVNAPDLYIPVMAYVTYVLLAGLVLGIQNRFSPEKLGMHASTAVAWTAVEIILELMFLYVTNIQSNLKIFDLISYSGYKYVGIILAILVGQVFQWTGYLVCILYCGAAMAFFMMRSLKFRVSESPSQNMTPVDMYNYQPSNQGTKRRLYFLLFVAVFQPLLMTWVSYHLINSQVASGVAGSTTGGTSPPL